jgi:nicotinate phosphoribosyltransferase
MSDPSDADRTGLGAIYRPSLALLTDLYELTMAYAYWKAGVLAREAVFHLTFRSHPFQGGFSIACGLAEAVDCLRLLRFTDEDLAYLATLPGNDDRPLFDRGFLDYLREFELRVDLDAVPEGTVVFPHEPLLRVSGPLLHCQLVETPLLNIVNFQTLIATKAARICLAARGEPVLEFGLRRAHGPGAALAASRAAYVGGCAGTSNALAGRLYGIPLRGTHAHSWVMAFGDELSAFLEYARAMPNNGIFLVDTYDSLAGVRHAIEAGRLLRELGHDLGGIRLDSGDLAYLSIEARKLLDEAGFPKAAILASNDLDEEIIASLKDQGARISVWGVGTRLVTGGSESSLGGVYKLGALREPGQAWDYKIKLSEQAVKTSNPGIHQVRRYRNVGGYVADLLFDVELGVADDDVMIDPLDPTRRKRLPPAPEWQDLLEPVLRAGRAVHEPPTLEDARRRVRQQLEGFHAGVKRFVNPHRYPVGLEGRLFDLKTRLVLRARGLNG